MQNMINITILTKFLTLGATVYWSGKMWHETVKPWSMLSCQIPTKLVYCVTLLEQKSTIFGTFWTSIARIHIPEMPAFQNEKEGYVFGKAQRAKVWGSKGRKLRPKGVEFLGKESEPPLHHVGELGVCCKLPQQGPWHSLYWRLRAKFSMLVCQLFVVHALMAYWIRKL